MTRGPVLVKRAAMSLLLVGSLLLAFVAYQLWGTALYEHSAQHRLQQQLKGALHTVGTLPSVSKQTSADRPSSESLENRTAPPTADPAVGSPVGLLSIPAIGITDAAIVEGTGESQLEEGPGHYTGTPLPGEAGNSAIAGHRTTYGAPFYNLDALRPGDMINIETPQGLFGYQVAKTTVVLPTDTSVLQPTLLPELTLTTCNPRYSSTQRLVVQALLRTSITNASFPATPPRQPSRGLPTSLAGGAEGASGAGGSNVRGGVIGAVLWGLGAVLAALASRFAFRRFAGAPRLLAVPGLVVAVYFLLACFQHVSLALPASF